MQKWQYRLVDQRDLDERGVSRMLCEVGAQGWELVCPFGNGHNLIFKRPEIVQSESK